MCGCRLGGVMTRTAWKPSVNYNDIRRATDARRRELVAKMRARTAQSAEPIAEPVSVVAGPGVSSPIVSGVLADDGVNGATRQVPEHEVSTEVASIESHVDPVSGLSSDNLSDGRLSAMPAAISAREPTCVEAENWLGRVGLADRAGLGIIADLLRESAMLPPRTLRVEVSWPSQWPNPVLAWAARSVSGLDPEDQELRVSFLGDGRLEMRELDKRLVPRASAAQGWPPQRDTSIKIPKYQYVVV